MPSHLIEASRAEATPPAAGSSFYAGMRVLPPPQRRAMFEIYRFCRAVDDVADGNASRDARLAELTQWRADIRALFAHAPPERVRALLEPVRTFDLQCADFLSIIDGMEMDAATEIRAPDLATLDLYCDRVACAVGRLSVRVFGVPRSKGIALASRLGRALQLTNILRDLDEDAGKGRLYLPREALVAAGIHDTEPSAVLNHPAVGVACRSLVDQARDHFAAARELMTGEPLHVVRAPRLMAQVYLHLLDRLEQRGWAPLRCPIRLGRTRLLWIVLLHGFLAVDLNAKGRG
jgi:squalene synthase HpnD